MFKTFILLFLTLTFQTIYAADIAVVTMAIGQEYSKIVQPGIENKRVYCQLHNYDFICGENSLDLERPIPWSKIPLILQAMENPEYKWIFWTDADSVIMNYCVCLEDLIDENYDIIICEDINDLCSGEFLIKNTEWSKSFLKTVYEHTECLFHALWENQAIILEFYGNSDVRDHTKVMPQRIMNSFAKEVFGTEGLSVTYHPGDFIVHFAGLRDKKKLSFLMEKYSKETITNDEDLFTLDYYLSAYGLQNRISESYLSPSQQIKFNQYLENYPNIKTIAEIGFNAGHSAENFFNACKNLEMFVSFDINQYFCTKVGIEFMTRKYKSRFEFIEGNSLVTVPKFIMKFPGRTFDLIYFDTNREYLNCYHNFINSRSLAHSETILLIDDYIGDCRKAVDECVRKGLMAIDSINSTYDVGFGYRFWIKAHYENTIH